MPFMHSDGQRFVSEGSRGRPPGKLTVIAAVLVMPLLAYGQTSAQDLFVSGTVYQNVGQAATLAAGKLLASSTAGGTNGVATADGQFQNVFLNAGPDAAFGVTTQIFLQDLSTTGGANPTASFAAQYNIDPGSLVGSFSSKSELALNLTSDGSAITFMGYNPTQSFSSIGANGVAAVATGGAGNLGLLDISNSNTPGLVDPTNGVNGQAYRSVAQINLSSLASSASATGSAGVFNLGVGAGLGVTNTNAYSGNNGRAAVLLNGQYYMAGNAGNSGSGVLGTTLSQLSQNTGVQTIAAGATSANSTVVGACTGTNGAAKGFQCGFNVNPSTTAGDKTGKDDNFRGMTVFGGNMYVTKGSGSNGVNTVYQVSGYSNPATATISVLPGFPTSGATGTPFGLWFANANTLYVAYEGSDKIAGANGQLAGLGGLTKYSLINNTWVADYTMTNGLAQGYTVNDAAGQSFAVGSAATPTKFYTDGLRNISGRVNADGTVTIYGVTSTVTDSSVSAAWDQGANPDQVVVITDTLAANTLGTQSFATVQTATAGTVFRGVALAPVPEPSSYALMLAGLGVLGFVRRRKNPARTAP
jgi:hypothetical protein